MRRLLQVLAVSALGAVALADVTDINSVKVEARKYNDFPNSTLVVTDNFPALLEFDESNFGEGGWANMHVGWFSADSGGSAYLFKTGQRFEIMTTAYLDCGSTAPRKEAGFRYNTPTLGEGLFIITSDGEVAAFGANLPFYSFGKSAYAIDTEVRMGLIYTPGAGADTIEYIFGDQTSGPLNFASDFPSLINDSTIGLYAQNSPDKGNPEDYSVVRYTDTTIVPEPATMGLLLLAGVALSRRR